MTLIVIAAAPGRDMGRANRLRRVWYPAIGLVRFVTDEEPAARATSGSGSMTCAERVPGGWWPRA